MTLIDDFREGEGASHALVASLAQTVAAQSLDPIFSGDDWAILPNGQIIDARSMGDAPFRRMGRHTVFEPDSFAEMINRYATGATTVWADRGESTVVAIFNDHPATRFAQDGLDHDGREVTEASAGHGDHSGVLQLALHDDYRSWMQHDGKLLSQRDFGEHIEDMAHTMVEPDAATMLEIATTLTMKSVIDGSSKVRLDNGDVQFRFHQETTQSAGRGAKEVAIPSTFRFSVPVWEGTEPVEFTARLRVRPLQHEGVQMGFRLTQRSDLVREAFDQLMSQVESAIPPFVQIFRGRATR